MESLCTIGAIASKNASAFSSVSSRMASASGAEVSGPVATMTLRQSAGGRPSISARSISIRGWSLQRLGDGGGKSVAVDRQGAAGRHLVGVGGAHDQRTQPAHFGMQQPDGVIGGIIGAERIGAHEFGEAVGAVRLGHPVGAHLVQDDADAGIGDLPGGFGAGEAGADDMHGFRGGFGACHRRRGSAFPCAVECAAGSHGRQIRQRPQRGGRYPFVSRLKTDQPL